MTARHVVINSNKWFSAVTDYSLQLSKFLKDNGDVVVCSFANSPLTTRAALLGLNIRIFSFIPYGFFAFIRCWVTLSKLLAERLTSETSENHFVWVFEGREHTLCAIHRLLNASLWKNTKLVRVRGQAQPIRASFFNRKLYLDLTDKIVFAAGAVARLAPFYLSNKQALVQLYCAPKALANGKKLKQFSFLADVPAIDFSQPVFLVVGRYDPVKGHAELIDAFAKANFNQQLVQLVCIGESQNVRMSSLFEKSVAALGSGKSEATRAFAENQQSTKRIFFFDERVENVRDFIASAHFGLIPSLGSEVICRVAVEFLQAGTPVVASYVGALNEVLTGSPARVYSPQSQQQFIEALEWAAEKAVDTPAHDKMRSDSQQKGDDYDLSRFSRLLNFVCDK